MVAALIGCGSGPLYPNLDLDPDLDADPDLVSSTEALAVPIREGATALGPQGWCQQVAMWSEALSLPPGPGQALGAWGMGHPHLGIPVLSREPS